MEKYKEWSGQKLDMRLRNRKAYLGSPQAGPSILKIYQSLFKKAIRRKRDFKALVLGATPELCDLVLKFGGELTLCDASLEAMMKSEKVMRFSLGKAILVKSGWLNNPLADSYYDIVLGDLIFLNVSLEEQDILANEIKRLLKKGGCFITRNVVFAKRKYSLKEIELNFQKGRIHWFDAFMDFLLCSPLTKKCQRGEIVDLDKFQMELDRINKLKIISDRLYFQLKKFQPIGTRAVLKKERFENNLKRYFKLIPVKQAADFRYTQDMMIFYFGKVRK